MYWPTVKAEDSRIVDAQFLSAYFNAPHENAKADRMSSCMRVPIASLGPIWINCVYQNLLKYARSENEFRTKVARMCQPPENITEIHE